MKKYALTIIFVIVALFATPTVAAQTFDAQKAYSDYQYQLSIYQQDYSDFQDAKTFYLANPTLQLKEDARQKTLKMLKDRDQLLIVYLTAIRMQIVESNGFDDSQKNAIFGKIDPEIDWYKNHIPNYQNTDELVDLFNKSDESKSRYSTNTTPVIDEGLFDIGLSQEIGLRLSHKQIYSDLKNYINDQVAAGKLRIDPFNRWLNDIDVILQQLQTNESSANSKIQEMYSKSYGVNSTYEDATQILASSINPITQLNNYLTEMLASIQNQTQ
jgi:hypothetical protein